MDIFGKLAALVLGGTVILGGVQVRRSSLDGFDVGDERGLVASEVPQAVRAFRTRIIAAMKMALNYAAKIGVGMRYEARFHKTECRAVVALHFADGTADYRAAGVTTFAIEALRGAFLYAARDEQSSILIKA